MSEITGYTIFAFALIIIGAAVYAMLVSAWHVLHDDGQLRLERMLKRHGASLDLAAGEFGSYHMAAAVRRCVACADKPACDAWLGAGKREGAAAFCPNAALVQRIARET
jgi:hypothetical protein